MTKALSTATMRVWQNNAPPGVSETSAELNNFFYDTNAIKLYICTNPSSGIQTWANLVDSGVTTLPSLTSIGTLTTLKTAPPASNTATTGFGTSLTAGTAVQNTLGYDILVNISVQVSAATGATLVVGVGPTNTPTKNTVVNSFSVAAVTILNFSVIVPNSYYLLVDDTGTITLSSITTQVCAI